MANSLHQSRHEQIRQRETFPRQESSQRQNSNLSVRKSPVPPREHAFASERVVPGKGLLTGKTRNTKKQKNQKSTDATPERPTPPDPARTLGPASGQPPGPACRTRYRAENSPGPPKGHIHFLLNQFNNNNKAGWPNGKALDYESRDCRFDPCVGQSVEYHRSINDDTFFFHRRGAFLAVFEYFWELGILRDGWEGIWECRDGGFDLSACGLSGIVAQRRQSRFCSTLLGCIFDCF
jgi:hypothetical protein